MTLRNRLLIMIALLVLPALVRVLFYYQFPYWNSNVKTPDYVSFSVSEPPTPSSQVKPAAGMADGRIVLVDNSHGNQFQPDEIEPLVTALNTRGARVEVDDKDKTLQAKLKYASAYLIFSPSTDFSGDEILQIQQFVAGGGRLLVFADPTRSLIDYDLFGNATIFPDVNFANPVVAPFGLAFTNDYLYNLKNNEGNFRNVEFTSFGKNPLTQDLKMVVFYGAHGVHSDHGTLLASGNADLLSSLTDKGGGLSSMALSADGQVLAIGDFTFLTNPFNQVADNNLLLAHIADFILGGQRTPQLANFPYVFQRPASLVFSDSNTALSSDLLGPIATLQQSLNAVNIPVTVASKAGKDNDLILLGTFSDIDTNLASAVQPFDLLNGDGAVSIRGFGKIDTSGNGLLLFSHGPANNTLILLTDSASNLPALIKLVAGGDLSACVVQGNVGVCSLTDTSSDSGFDSGSGDFGSITDTPTPDPFTGP